MRVVVILGDPYKSFDGENWGCHHTGRFKTPDHWASLGGRCWNNERLTKALKEILFLGEKYIFEDFRPSCIAGASSSIPVSNRLLHESASASMPYLMASGRQ